MRSSCILVRMATSEAELTKRSPRFVAFAVRRGVHYAYVVLGLAVVINGQQVFITRDGTYRAGSAALSASVKGAEPQELRLDNLVVR